MRWEHDIKASINISPEVTRPCASCSLAIEMTNAEQLRSCAESSASAAQPPSRSVEARGSRRSWL